MLAHLYGILDNLAGWLPINDAIAAPEHSLRIQHLDFRL